MRHFRVSPNLASYLNADIARQPAKRTYIEEIDSRYKLLHCACAKDPVNLIERLETVQSNQDAYKKYYEIMLRDKKWYLPERVTMSLKHMEQFAEELAFIVVPYLSLGKKEFGLAKCYFNILKVAFSLKCFISSTHCPHKEHGEEYHTFARDIRVCCNY